MTNKHRPQRDANGVCPVCGRRVIEVDPLGFAKAGYDMASLTPKARATLYLRHVGR